MDNAVLSAIRIYGRSNAVGALLTIERAERAGLLKMADGAPSSLSRQDKIDLLVTILRAGFSVFGRSGSEFESDPGRQFLRSKMDQEPWNTLPHELHEQIALYPKVFEILHFMCLVEAANLFKRLPPHNLDNVFRSAIQGGRVREFIEKFYSSGEDPTWKVPQSEKRTDLEHKERRALKEALLGLRELGPAPALARKLAQQRGPESVIDRVVATLDFLRANCHDTSAKTLHSGIKLVLMDRFVPIWRNLLNDNWRYPDPRYYDEEKDEDTVEFLRFRRRLPEKIVVALGSKVEGLSTDECASIQTALKRESESCRQHLARIEAISPHIREALFLRNRERFDSVMITLAQLKYAPSDSIRSSSTAELGRWIGSAAKLDGIHFPRFEIIVHQAAARYSPYFRLRGPHLNRTPYDYFRQLLIDSAAGKEAGSFE